MRVAFGTDTSNTTTSAVVAHIRGMGHVVEVVADPAPWPDVGRKVGEMVAAHHAELGVVCCWTGTGVSMAANKVTGVRAALCHSAEIATGARKWNDANVLALGVASLSVSDATVVVDAFFDPDIEVDADEADNIATVTDA
ncbi:MAG TPA: RpiB/LacA/LacB family sugar-phosphate isomerase [Acidimicrobiales bacterium]|jgi:ribose 5-phosphate isomerase B